MSDPVYDVRHGPGDASSDALIGLFSRRGPGNPASPRPAVHLSMATNNGSAKDRVPKSSRSRELIRSVCSQPSRLHSQKKKKELAIIYYAWRSNKNDADV